MKPLSSNDYVFFALINPIEGSWGFTGYSDASGHSYRATNGTTVGGIPKNYEIYWSASERIYRAPKDRKITVIFNGDQMERMLLVDYIRNSPNCEGSPNNQSGIHPVIFKELDEVKDAELKVSRRLRRNEAITAAAGLEDQDLIDMGALIGEFRNDKFLLLDKVSEFANNDPESFFKLYKDPTRQVKALIRKALQSGKLKKTGDAIFWGNESLGGNEDQAVAWLIAQPAKLEALTGSVDIVPKENINGPKKPQNKK